MGTVVTEYLTEQEQIELLKNWIKQYSLVILLGIFLASVMIFGWRTWQERQFKLSTHASLIFDEMLTARVQRNHDALSSATDKLLAHYSRTVYSPFAVLMLARQTVVQKNYPEAQKQLMWVIQHSDVASIRQIARLRLARILLALHQPKESLETLKKDDDRYFTGLIDEVRGDAYLAMNNPHLAKEWYTRALNDLPNAEVIRPLLQMKLDNLA